jgi:superfamily II DNA or RNA helicase
MKSAEHFEDLPNPGIALFAEPKDFHFAALNQVLKARQTGRQRALLTIPVGMGRNLLAAADLVNYYNSVILPDPSAQPHMLYVTSGNLMHQEAQQKITAFLPELTVSTELQQPPQAGLTFSTFRALSRQLDQIDPGSFDYITWHNFNDFDNRSELDIAKHFAPTFSLALQTTPAVHGAPLEEYFGASVYQPPHPLA